MSKQYWIATRKGETPRVAKYASSLFALQDNGFTLKRGLLPKDYWYITLKKKHPSRL